MHTKVHIVMRVARHEPVVRAQERPDRIAQPVRVVARQDTDQLEVVGRQALRLDPAADAVERMRSMEIHRDDDRELHVGPLSLDAIRAPARRALMSRRLSVAGFQSDTPNETRTGAPDGVIARMIAR